MRKVAIVVMLVMSIVCINASVFAHGGRTDSRGGHKDNKNVSGLGSYHYHCDGHPAHLHTNGVCPYSSSASSNTTQQASVSTPTPSTPVVTPEVVETPKPTTIDVESIKINESIDNMDVGQSKKLTASITPTNATNKNVTWSTSNANVATVDSSGNVCALSAGVVTISAKSVNGKTSTVEIEVVEEIVEKVEEVVEEPVKVESDAKAELEVEKVEEPVIEMIDAEVKVDKAEDEEDEVVEVGAFEEESLVDEIETSEDLDDLEQAVENEVTLVDSVDDIEDETATSTDDSGAGAVITLAAIGGAGYLLGKRKK